MRIHMFKVLAPALVSIVLGCYAPSVEADQAPCKTVPVTVVNSSFQDVNLVGAAGPSVIKAKSSTQIAFQSKTFYDRCGLMEVGLGDGAKRGLIDSQATSVAIHIAPDGQVTQIGMTEAGLNLDNYIAWYGLKKILA
jgi:hypothetical protein